MKLSDNILKAEKLFLLLFFAFAFIFTFVYSAMDKNVVVEDAPLSYIDSWMVKDPDGNTFSAGRNYTSEQKLEGDYEIVATLPDDVTDNMVLFFKPCWRNLVYINGQLRWKKALKGEISIPTG